jgi:heat shock protein HtpX
LVAVSTGLLQSMTKEEVEAVIGHEIAHVANGDMVTMTLIQGVMNTFVFFLSRVLATVIDSALRKGDDRSGPGFAYMAISMVLQIVLGFLASIVVAWFSRHREFKADAGAAGLMGQSRSMQAALMRLGGMAPGELPKNMAAMGIAGDLGKLFSTHPPMEERIAALQALKV